MRVGLWFVALSAVVLAPTVSAEDVPVGGYACVEIALGGPWVQPHLDECSKVVWGTVEFLQKAVSGPEA
jgi:hypothetical protein